MEFSGKIIEILPERSGISAKSGETWHSQDFVVESDGRYPVRICFNAFGEERIKKLDLKLNESVTVHFDISARKSGSAWYNDVGAYSVQHHSRVINKAGTGEPQGEVNDTDQKVLDSLRGNDDDMPY